MSNLSKHTGGGTMQEWKQGGIYWYPSPAIGMDVIVQIMPSQGDCPASRYQVLAYKDQATDQVEIPQEPRVFALTRMEGRTVYPANEGLIVQVERAITEAGQA